MTACRKMLYLLPTMPATWLCWPMTRALTAAFSPVSRPPAFTAARCVASKHRSARTAASLSTQHSSPNGSADVPSTVAALKALGVKDSQHPARAAEAASHAWQPWRSYAVIQDWSQLS